MNDAAVVLTREQDVIRWAQEREQVAPIADPQDFGRHAHQLIWSAILSLQAQGKSVDYLALRAEIERRGQMEAVGAIYLHELSRDSVSPSDAALVTAAEEIKTAARTGGCARCLAAMSCPTT